MKLICGLDPGTEGAFALVNRDGTLIVDDLPVHNVRRGRSMKLRAELDLQTMELVLREYRIEHVFLERVAARPGQGVVSMFRFGYAAGALYGLVVGLGLPVTRVLPRAWQKHHGIDASPDAARQRAVQLYPAAAARLTLKRHAHRADALLLADFGLQQRGHDRLPATPTTEQAYHVIC
jgi:crossover junction endodeoxyribonuclease RuvC